MARIATVFLATGLQGMYRACFRACGLHLMTSPGSSVIRALLKDGTFTPRAVTRDATSDAAQALLKQGCEVVEVQLDNKESVKKAVTGAEVVALVRWGGGGLKTPLFFCYIILSCGPPVASHLRVTVPLSLAEG